MSTAADARGVRPAGPIAVVAHDAGGAEVLSSYVRRRELPWRFALAGPACSVFERKLGRIENLTLAAALQHSEGLLCGTSWQSDLELEAIALARGAGKPSVAWLDHWVHYRDRFARAGRLCLPDEIWVSDTAALTLARKQLPELNISLLENPYLEDVRSELANILPVYPRMATGSSVLYVSEPVREAALRQFGNALHWGYTEEKALQYFLDNIGALGSPVGRIVIRPHPSEAEDKYRGVAADYALPISFSRGHSLSAEVISSDCIVGCASMAMVVGLIAGKRVVSCIPPGGPPCSLPHPEIQRLQDLVRPS